MVILIRVNVPERLRDLLVELIIRYTGIPVNIFIAFSMFFTKFLSFFSAFFTKSIVKKITPVFPLNLIHF